MPARRAVERLQRLASSSLCSTLLDTFHSFEQPDTVAAWAPQLQALLAQHLQTNLYQVSCFWSQQYISFHLYLYACVCLCRFPSLQAMKIYFLAKQIGSKGDRNPLISYVVLFPGVVSTWDMAWGKDFSLLNL